MIVGVPKEIKQDEYRVALLAGWGRGAYAGRASGARARREPGWAAASPTSCTGRTGRQIVDWPAEMFARAELIIKVKEPLPGE